MMGKRTLREIRARLKQAGDEADIDPAAWIDRQIPKKPARTSRRAGEIETLKLIRDGLKKSSRRRLVKK